MAKGRVKKKVVKTRLAAAFKEAEDKGPLKNISVLCQAAAKIYNRDTKKTEDHITHSVANLRLKEWCFKVKTKPGRVVRSTKTAGDGTPLPTRRLNKAERLATPEMQKSFRQMEADVPKKQRKRFQPIIDKIRGGSKSAALQFMCITCSGYETSEVRKCRVEKCPLFPFRPYQGAVAVSDEEAAEAENDLDAVEALFEDD